LILRMLVAVLWVRLQFLNGNEPVMWAMNNHLTTIPRSHALRKEKLELNYHIFYFVVGMVGRLLRLKRKPGGAFCRDGRRKVLDG